MSTGKTMALATAAAMIVATPAAAEPYRNFTDVKTRAAEGTSVIRAFPSATAPTFRLLLERRTDGFCIVWLEFARGGLPIDHIGPYGFPATGTRRALAMGPLQNDSTHPPEPGFVDHYIQSWIDNQHWVARGKNDALEIISAAVDVDDYGACVAGVRSQFTANLPYRDVVDISRLSNYGEARVRGFPGETTSFKLVLQLARAGTEVHDFTDSTVTLSEDACILWLEFAPWTRPVYTPSALLPGNLERRVDLLAVGANLGIGEEWVHPLPWLSHGTGEVFRLVYGRLAFHNGECETEIRAQFATTAAGFYR
jgi:hypothetical protein